MYQKCSYLATISTFSCNTQGKNCLSNLLLKITNSALENDHVCSIQPTEHNYCLTN